MWLYERGDKDSREAYLPIIKEIYFPEENEEIWGRRNREQLNQKRGYGCRKDFTIKRNKIFY